MIKNKDTLELCNSISELSTINTLKKLVIVSILLYLHKLYNLHKDSAEFIMRESDNPDSIKIDTNKQIDVSK